VVFKLNWGVDFMKKSSLIIFVFSVLILMGCTQAEYSPRSECIIDNHTVGLWHFNEGNGLIVNDATNNNYNGNILGASWVDGFYNGALLFNGVDGYVNIPNFTQPYTGQITVEALVKPSLNINSNNRAEITSHAWGTQQFYYLRGELCVNLYETGHISHVYCHPTILSANEWYFLAFTAEVGGDVNLFVNENTYNLGSAPQTLETATNDLRISVFDRSFPGTIDEVRISDIARTDFCFDIEEMIDTDSDGIIDSQDNCINTFNPSQTDFDRDRVGDWCDNCIMTWNHYQEDSDGDFIGNACETFEYTCSINPSPTNMGPPL